MKFLIAFPLAALVVLSLMSMLGLGATDLGQTILSINPDQAMYYDSNGNGKLFIANLTNVKSVENLVVCDVTDYAMFYNETLLGIPVTYYELYYDNAATYPVLYADMGKTYQGGFGSIDISSSLGLIGVVIGLMALAAIVGLRIVGSGVSDVSVSTIILGTALLTIWGVFSVLGLALLLQIDLLGPIAYFILTVMYTAGIVMSVGGNSSD